MFMGMPNPSSIDGVAWKDLVTHPDERGFFREIIRRTDDFFTEGFGQWSWSRMHTGVVKAWHLHRRQVDWWMVPQGSLKAVMHDLREDSPTRGATLEVLLGEAYAPRVLRIPPGVAHGCKVLDGPCSLFYITSQVYTPADELRIPHDDPGIGYDWLKGPDIT
jgi:dTDP-4-dehydrorhamnose 3,5-epimerase